MKRFLETHKKGYRLLKMMHGLNRSAVPVFLLWALAEALWPYIGILLGARIIDRLLMGDWRGSVMTAAGMLALSFTIGLLLDWLRKESEIISLQINRQCGAHVCEKSISLDYETFADKENLEGFEAAEYNLSRNGGFGMLLTEYSVLTRNVFRLAASAGILADFCVKEAEGKGILGFFLSAPGSFLTVLLLLLVLGFFYARFAGYVNDHSLRIFEKSKGVNQEQEYFQYEIFMSDRSAKTLRMYGMGGVAMEKWKNMALKSLGFYRERWKFEDGCAVGTGLLNNLVLLAAYLLVALKTWAGAVTVGGLAKYAGAIIQLNEAMKNIIESNDRIRLYTSYLSYYTQYLEKPNKLDTGTLPVEKRLDHLYELEFHDVGFQYPGSEEWALRHVSVTLDMKHKFAVVGPNGAGKTTFIKLLCRFYDVTEGAITLNGIDIRKYDYEEYLGLFAAVFQDFGLFSFPVGENIACSMEPEEDRVWEALRLSGAEKRVRQMKDGLKTPLYFEEEGGEAVSGGEAQKLAIARALYKDAPFVILDEPTAALDPISEYEIYSRFDEMVKDKTSIYISHRMSSCRFCQDILVFDGGRLVQRGDHGGLMEEDGIYRKLWASQAKYYQNT